MAGCGGLLLGYPFGVAGIVLRDVPAGPGRAPQVVGVEPHGGEGPAAVVVDVAGGFFGFIRQLAGDLSSFGGVYSLPVGGQDFGVPSGFAGLGRIVGVEAASGLQEAAFVVLLANLRRAAVGAADNAKGGDADRQAGDDDGTGQTDAPDGGADIHGLLVPL